MAVPAGQRRRLMRLHAQEMEMQEQAQLLQQDSVDITTHEVPEPEGEPPQPGDGGGLPGGDESERPRTPQPNHGQKKRGSANFQGD